MKQQARPDRVDVRQVRSNLPYDALEPLQDSQHPPRVGCSHGCVKGKAVDRDPLVIIPVREVQYPMRGHHRELVAAFAEPGEEVAPRTSVPPV